MFLEITTYLAFKMTIWQKKIKDNLSFRLNSSFKKQKNIVSRMRKALKDTNVEWWSFIIGKRGVFFWHCVPEHVCLYVGFLSSSLGTDGRGSYWPMRIQSHKIWKNTSTVHCLTIHLILCIMHVIFYTASFFCFNNCETWCVHLLEAVMNILLRPQTTQLHYLCNKMGLWVSTCNVSGTIVPCLYPALNA